MDFFQKHPRELPDKRFKTDNKKSINQCHSENNDEQNYKTNVDKDTLNLFKGIVKITNVQSNNLKKSPIIKSNSASAKNIMNYTNTLYKKEEHLQKNHINIMKKCENNILQETQIKTFSHKLSTNENCEKSISSLIIPHLSKEKNITTVRKSLFKKSSCNDIGQKNNQRMGLG